MRQLCFLFLHFPIFLPLSLGLLYFLCSSVTYNLYKKQYVVISECSAARQWCVLRSFTLHFFVHFSISVTHMCFQCLSSKTETNKRLFPGKCSSPFSFTHFLRTRNQTFKPYHGWPFSRLFYISEWGSFQQIFSAASSFMLVCSNETRGLKFLCYGNKCGVWVCYVFFKKRS